ncbi:hypothetical protein pipiens_000004 [Culex pipiens pipiens]|uniref:Uncharacterized protein n=1 Tax=Culex pipiens pipiens TaxID=38569 RepID=A0ABD1D184_CULPP
MDLPEAKHANASRWCYETSLGNLPSLRGKILTNKSRRSKRNG